MEKLVLIFILIWINILTLFYKKKDKLILFEVSLFLSIFIFLVSIYKLIIFNKSFFKVIQFFYYEEFNYFSFGSSCSGLDNLSILFFFLICFIIPTCILYTKDYILDYNYNLYLICIFLIKYLLISCFLTFDIFFFFIYFEATIIPMFLIIVFWGSRSRKIKASFYLVMYATISSFFFILALIIIWSNINSLNILILRNFNWDFNIQIILWFFIFLTLAVKVPIFPFHIWLPEAHVEAPTVGSVILASLILKLGSYGFIRILIPLFPYSNKFLSPLINCLCFLGVMYGSLIAIRQIDFKKIIAYSSVVHMNYLIIGLFSFNFISYIGSIYMMLAHGITSSALFFLAGILYDRFKSRIIFYYTGLVYIMPIYSFFLFYFFFSNFGFPGSVNFIGELMILLGIINYSFFFFLIIMLSFFFSILYSIWLPNRILFSTLKLNYGISFDLDEKEFYILILYFLLSLYLGIFPNEFLNFIN